MLDNNKMMLAYGLSSEELESLKMTNFQVKEITTEMASMKIGQIIEGLKFEIHDKKIPQEKVVLFNNFPDEELDKAIKSVRASIGREGILAVVTPTSANWTFDYLIEHLIEEREWFKQNRPR
ncbi:DUF3783 domain-containing protein [Clostridium polynesiense]|uniref:DUF3783 domain-containing protein n=1 Tax=Clostridium polynesiense TaxID=1325933 RepID=UPI00059086EC|nr:DUF3783 domain-containing protein [Clostridium polynesiense]